MYQLSWKRQLFLSVGLLALGSVVYWHEFSYKPKQEAKSEGTKRLFPIKDQQIASIKVDDGIKVLELRCTETGNKLCKPGDQSRWEIVLPKKFNADSANANSLLSTLESTQPVNTIELNDETAEKRKRLLSDYGLSEEAIKSRSARSIEVTSTQGKKITAYLGGTHPIGDNIFTLISIDGKADESRVLLLPPYLKSQFDHDLTYWRDKKLFTFDSQKIDKLEFKGIKGSFQAEKSDRHWLIKKDKAAPTLPADAEGIEGLLASINYLNAKQFVSDNSADAKAKQELQGTKKILEIKAQEQNNSYSLSLFEKSGKKKEDPKRLLAIASTVDALIEVEFTTRDRLDKTINDLRMNRFFASLDRFAIRKMVFSGQPIGPFNLTFKQEGSDWVALDSLEKKLPHSIDGAKLQSLLDKLSSKQIKDFIPAGKIPAGEQQGIKIELFAENGDPKWKLLFWKSGPLLYAKDLTSKRNEAFLVDSSLGTSLPWQKGFFEKAGSPAPSPKPEAGKSK